MNKDIALRFLQKFSVLTIGDSKQPNFKWKDCQTEKLSEDKFLKLLNLDSTKGLGIVTGFENLEVIDVDLKVFSTTKEMNDFWNEYLTTLRELIYDFDNKFVIYKTKSGGYHILYKSKRGVGNKNLQF